MTNYNYEYCQRHDNYYTDTCAKCDNEEFTIVKAPQGIPQKGQSKQNSLKPKASHSLRFFVPSNPIPKARPRFGAGKVVYNEEKVTTYEKLVKDCADAAMLKQGYEMPSKDEPLMIILHFYREDKRGADTDNLQKAVMDALNKRAFLDDRQILAAIVTIERGVGKARAGVWVIIRPYYPELSIIENLEALGG